MSKFSILYTVNPKKGMVFKMAKSTFKGGVHPYEGKELSKDKPIKDVLPKGDLVYPLSQHIGAPAVAIVAKGDRVLRGQKIAEAGGFVSSPIFSSVSGTVKKIDPDVVTEKIGKTNIDVSELAAFLGKYGKRAPL